MSQTVFLGDYINIKSGKSRPKEKGCYVVYGGNGIFDTAPKPNMNEPAVIVGRVGAYCGSVYIEKKPFWLSDNALGITAKNDTDLDFIYYLLKSIDLNNKSVGGAQPLLTQGILNSIKVTIPDPEIQKKIASDLRSLDEKIELNRKMKETLEQMGQALFNKYFITNPEAKKTNIGQLTNETSKKIGKDNHGDYVVLSAVKTGELVSSQDYFTKQVFSKDISKYKRISINEFAYNPARVNIGSIGMLDSDIKGAVSPVYVTFRARDDYHNAISELLKLNSTKKRIIDLCTGTVRQVLRYSDFCRVNAWEVDDATLVKFNHHYEQLDKLLKQKKAENQTLITLRDNLLPRLISGRLKL